MDRMASIAERVAAGALTAYGILAEAGKGLKTVLSVGGQRTTYTGRPVDSWERIDFDSGVRVPVQSYEVSAPAKRGETLESFRTYEVSVHVYGAGNQQMVRIDTAFKPGTDISRSAHDFLEREVPMLIERWMDKHPEAVGNARERDRREQQVSYGPGKYSGD
jgi:hypothetical protein